MDNRLAVAGTARNLAPAATYARREALAAAPRARTSTGPV